MKMVFHTLMIAVIGVVFFLSLSVAVSFGDNPLVGTGSEWALEAESLAKALQMFSVRHQVLTTYEDPVLQFRADLQDISSKIYRASDVRGVAKFPPVYTRRQLKLNLVYHLSTNNPTVEEITRALQEIVDAYNAGEYPGKFKVEPTPPVWHIIPTEAKNEKGEWVKVTPFLGRVVEVQAGRKRLYKYIFSVMKPAVSNSPVVKFGFNRNPIGSNPPDINIVGGTLSLRDLLTHIFVSNFDGMIWQMECGATKKPGELLGRYLNLYQIKPKPQTSVDRQTEAPRAEFKGHRPVSRNVLITPKQDPNDLDIFHIDVTGSTPLADTLEGFMRLHQVLVTYEDPIYEFSGDLDDQTMMRKDLHKYPLGQAPRVLQPKNMQFRAQYHLDAKKMAHDDVTAALQQILEQHNNGPRTAEFRLLEGSGIWHVVPSRVRDSSGLWKDVNSPFDEILHLNGGETNFLGFATSLLKETFEKDGLQLWVFASLPPQIIALPEGNFTLREVLTRLLTSNFVNMTWFMLNNPSDPPMRGMMFKCLRLPPEPLNLLVPHLTKLDGANWKAEVTDSPIPVLVAFLGAWSEPVRGFAAMLDELSVEFAGRLKIGMVDIGQQYDVPIEYDIRVMPTLLVVNDGEVRRQLQSIVSKSEMKKWIESALKKEGVTH